MSFLTARAASRLACTTRSAILPSTRHTVSTTSRLAADQDIGPGRTHQNDKPAADGKHNIQSAASQAGKASKAQGSEDSTATSQKDIGDNNARAKKDHPEAPEPVIGMNEERGGKGH